MPYITYDCGGRLGNCMFPFFFCIFIEMKYGYEYTEREIPGAATVTDEPFAKVFTEENVLQGRFYFPPCNLRLWGFFQHDWIFKHYRKELMAYLQSKPRLLSIMAKYTNQTISSDLFLQDALPSINPGPTDIVIHLRLEDYLTDTIQPNSPHYVISPLDYDPILTAKKYDTIYWVMNAPKLPIEHKYIAFLLKKWGGIYTPQTLEQDISLMRKAHTLVCSRSTLSWASSYLTPHTEQTVFLPMKKNDNPHEQCPGIYPKTIRFDHKKCTVKDLEDILNTQSE